MGNLTDDPEHRSTPSGQELTSFTIAVNTYAGAGREQKAAFYRCTVWGKRGEVIEKYVKKGRQLLVSGTLTVDSYTGKDGATRQGLNVNVDDFSFVGDRNDSGSNSNTDAGNASASADSGKTSDATTDVNVDEPIDLSDIPF